MTTLSQSAAPVSQEPARSDSRRRRWTQWLHAVGIYAILAVVAFVFILPLLWMMLTSIKTAQEAFYVPPTIIPQNPTLANFGEAWNHAGMNFTRWTWNTLYMSLTIVVGSVLTASLVAYGFARMRFPGRNFWFIATLASIMLPPQVTLIPLYVLFFQIGWLDTFKPLIIPAWFGGGAINIFLLRQFFLQIPAELEDAAYIDGANRLQIWWRIFVPLSGPALITVGLFTFQAAWNDFFGPLIYLTGRDNYTLALGMNLFNSQFGKEIHYMMAIAFLMSLPMIAIFFFAQRYYIRGVVLSGIKG